MQTVAMKGTDNKDTAGSMDAPAQSIRMTVFAIDDLKDWQNRIVEAVNDGAAARVCRRGGGCAVWSPRETARLSGTDLSYVDGACIVRQRIGRQAGSLGIIPRRMYFEGGAEIPSSQPEWRLMDGRRAPRAPATDRLQQCLNWAQHISRRVPGFSAEPMRVVRVRRDLHKSTKLVFGAGKTATAGCKTSEMILRHGFRSVPNNLRIEIASPAAAMDQARRYRTLLADAFKRCHCHGSLGLIGYDILGSRLIAGASPDPGSAILLAITGKKGLPLYEHNPDGTGRRDAQWPRYLRTLRALYDQWNETVAVKPKEFIVWTRDYGPPSRWRKLRENMQELQPEYPSAEKQAKDLAEKLDLGKHMRIHVMGYDPNLSDVAHDRYLTTDRDIVLSFSRGFDLISPKNDILIESLISLCQRDAPPSVDRLTKAQNVQATCLLSGIDGWRSVQGYLEHA